MDKIIELICEEARRRPGKDLVSKIYSVELEVRMELVEIMKEFRESELARALRE